MNETVEFTNLCMVRDGDRVLVIDRKKKDWPGITFPGGHVEAGESFTEAVIREVKEETGLRIASPRICGMKDWVEDATRVTMGGTEGSYLATGCQSLKPLSVRTGVCNPTPRSWIR